MFGFGKTAKMAKKRHSAKKSIKKNLFTFNNIVLLALLFALIVLFKAILVPVQSPAFKLAEKTNLEQEAKTLLDTVATEGTDISLIKSNELIEEKIEHLDNMDYNKFKDILGVKSDFCVYFEDATGNLIKVDGIEPGIGSEKIQINGKPCH